MGPSTFHSAHMGNKLPNKYQHDKLINSCYYSTDGARMCLGKAEKNNAAEAYLVFSSSHTLTK